MADYRTPLPALLAGFLEAGLGRLLAMDPESAGRLERLGGKTLAVNLAGLGIELFFSFEFGAVQVALASGAEPDTRVTGSPVALFAMAAPDEVGDWGLPGSGVRIEGDAGLARDLGKLFSQMEPDWEAPLASVLGDTLGFQVAAGIRQGAEAVREAARASGELAAGYFRDEAGVLVKPTEVREFAAAVDRLNDGVERLEVRVRRLAARHADDAGDG